MGTTLTLYGNPTTVDTAVPANNAVAQLLAWDATEAIVDISAYSPGDSLEFRALAEAGGSLVWSEAVQHTIA